MWTAQVMEKKQKRKLILSEATGSWLLSNKTKTQMKAVSSIERALAPIRMYACCDPVTGPDQSQDPELFHVLDTTGRSSGHISTRWHYSTATNYMLCSSIISVDNTENFMETR